MATPTIATKISLGSRDGVVATFSSLSNADTWVTGLSAIDHVGITNGASGQTVGATVSGGTVTFTLSGGCSNVLVLVIGFK